MVPLKELKEHPKNRTVHNDGQIARLAQIFEYQGIRHPIIISNLSGFIVAGHGRLAAAKKLGLNDFPCDYQDFSSEEEEYAFLVSDNSIALWAELDLAGINSDIGDLGPDFDIDLLGIKDFTLDVAEKLEPQCDEDEIPEKVEAKTKRGDIYKLGNHRLMCGDSTMIDDVEKLMAGEKAEMLFTDPPYGVNYEGGHFHSGDVNIVRKREKLAADDNADIYKEVSPIIEMFVDGPCYTWFASTKAKCVIEAIEAIEAIGTLSAMLVWHKTNATYGAMNAQYKQRHEPCFYWKPRNSTLRWCGASTESTLWEVKRDGRNEFHPTQKPVELAERAIKNHDAKNVLDLFGGSGSTLIAAEKCGRPAYLMEMSENYCDVIVARWEKYTGKKAELLI
jgi:DNA modification methylase